MFRVQIETDNAAFCPEEIGIGFGLGRTQQQAAPELARILRELAQRVERGVIVAPVSLYDVNGNKVGEAEWV